MPTYEYRCSIFDKEFEEFHSIMTVLEDCPLCKEAGKEPHKPERLISGGAGKGIVELTGNDLKQKIQQDAASLRRETMTSERTLANIVGENKYHSNELDRTRR